MTVLYWLDLLNHLIGLPVVLFSVLMVGAIVVLLVGAGWEAARTRITRKTHRMVWVDRGAAPAGDWIAKTLTVVMVWTAPPYLVTVAPAIAYTLVIRDWWDLFVHLIWVWILWNAWKNRKRKNRLRDKAAAVVRRVGDRLRVVPVPAGAR